MRPPIALLVDDDGDFRALFAEVLQEEGYRVVQAADGVQAVGMLESLVPDVMVIDLLMPVMNGWVLFAALDRRPELRAVPVVFLSAVPERAPRGGSLVVGKPLDLASLTTLLDALRPAPMSGEIPLETSPHIVRVYPLDRPKLTH